MKGILVETDLIVDYLTAGPGGATLLRRLLEVVPCYGTFIQAGEIYSAATGDEERRMAERALFGLKILGASGRYAKTIGEVLSSLASMGSYRTAIVAAMALESRLPVVTDAYRPALAGIPGVKLIAASELRRAPDHERLGALLAPHL